MSDDLTDGTTTVKTKSIETETVVLHKEAERKKPLSIADKRKRNETLAIGLSRQELLKAEAEKEPFTVTTSPETETSTLSENGIKRFPNRDIARS